MTEREKMLAGGWFDPRDAELTAIRDNATRLMHRLNVELCGHDDAYRAEIATIAEDLRAQLPPECRSLLGADPEAFASNLAVAARDGIDEVLARLKAGTEAGPG